MLVYRGLSLLSRSILPTFIARPQVISLPAFVKAHALQTTPRVAARASTAQVKAEKAPTKAVKKAVKPAKKVAKKVAKPAKKAKKPKEVKASWRGVKIPLKPKSPYISFYVDYLRDKKIASTADAQSLAKAAAAQWKSMSESDKERYRKIFNVELEQFHKEKQEWLKSVDPAVLKAVNLRREKLGKARFRSKHGPRPSGPFVRFIQDQKQTEVAGSTWKEKLVSLGAVWHGLPATEKERYKQLAVREFAERQAASPQL